ncbi:MAG: CDP-glycerol glycerophosphotransferase family protein [Marinifilaceae bacterium]
MKIVLFCEQKYTISMVEPIYEAAVAEGGHEVLWYIHEKNIPQFDLDVPYTNDIKKVYDFSPEAIFVPCNVVPYDLPGVKIQISHGYECGEKRYFRIRDYFDLYLTQGPYFTEGYKKALKHKRKAEVIETGWSRRDKILQDKNKYDAYKQELLSKHKKKKIALYAPTFPPSITSLPYMQEGIQRFVQEREDVLLILKFHPLTDKKWMEEYEKIANSNENMIWMADVDINKFLLISDVMISDSSSVVFEFLFLDKPVITYNNASQEKYWRDIKDPMELAVAFDKEITTDEFAGKRKEAIEYFDPYFDGNSCKRMLDAAKDYIKRNGVPQKRELGFFRRRKSLKSFK